MIATTVAAMCAFDGAARGDEPEPPAAEPGNATATGIFDRETLTGDWFGLRTHLEDRGLQLGADEIVEVLGNPVGGRKHGAGFEGRLEFFANVDLDKAVGWGGAIFHANAYQIHGRGLSANDVGNLLTTSNIEAQRSTRLFGLWLQQELLDRAVSVRAGQIAADDEFFVSQYATLFINSTFGWPAILGANLPSGGPAYPLATPGLRIKWAASANLAFMTAVFNGDPADPGPGSAQMRDAGGTSFRIDSDRFLIGEAAYSSNLNADATGLPGTFKLGAWYHSARFPDQRYDTSGLTLANPASTGVAASHRGDFGAYAIADQMIWREPGTIDQGVGAFVRAAGNPPDRNLIAFHADSGVIYKGLLRDRENDVVGISVSYARISRAQRAFARDLRVFTGVNRPLPDFESVVEATYQAQIAAWWIVQPDMQFVFHPGARIPDAAAGSQVRPVPDALIFGVRTAIVF